jgi:hypothetical protein
MNISKETIETLNTMYSFWASDNNGNEKPFETATEVVIGFEKNSEGICDDNCYYIGKSIKVPAKKEITVEWVLEKLGADKVYKDFAQYFKKLLTGNNFNCYPTSYGIGVFVAIGARKDIETTKGQIDVLLNNLGIQYTTQYSDAMWVFRYKISKSKENIEKIQKILEKS